VVAIIHVHRDITLGPFFFVKEQHIRGVRLHFIPESYKGTPELYQDITFEKDKTYVENTQIP